MWSWDVDIRTVSGALVKVKVLDGGAGQEIFFFQWNVSLSVALIVREVTKWALRVPYSFFLCFSLFHSLTCSPRSEGRCTVVRAGQVALNPLDNINPFSWWVLNFLAVKWVQYCLFKVCVTPSRQIKSCCRLEFREKNFVGYTDLYIGDYRNLDQQRVVLGTHVPLTCKSFCQMSKSSMMVSMVMYKFTWISFFL